jgi:hypothetical protein
MIPVLQVGDFLRALNWLLTGYRWYYTNGGLSNRGNYGYFWSSTRIGSGGYMIHFSSEVRFAGNSIRGDEGFPVRCVEN